MYDLIIIGGGAAGIFASVQVKAKNQAAKVLVLEKSAKLLSKVRVSGGGRCNVTHACFDPQELVKNYPRGSRELRGPFSRFQPRDTVEWFESRGVALKVEADRRIFPVSDDSETIINCLLKEADQRGVEIFLRQRIDSIKKVDGGFEVGSYRARRVLLATGSSPQGYEWAKELGHTIQEPVPSLFTFNVPSSPLKSLSGIAIDPVEVKIEGESLKQKGPLLITHFGFSGPAVLKLSAWGARVLHKKGYKFAIKINWLPEIEGVEETLLKLKMDKPNRALLSENPFNLPKNLWKALLFNEKMLNDFSKNEIQCLAKKLQEDIYACDGKTTHKEEFVTAGGVTLKEIDFKTMESKICPGLYFAGEILDIDGVTGGFNFQNAWTNGYLLEICGKSYRS